MKAASVLLFAVLAVAAAPAGAVAAPAPPGLISPTNGAEIPPRTGAVTFTVQGRAHERTGAMHIQLFDAETHSDSTGRPVRGRGDIPGHFDDFVLTQVSDTSTYAVTVSKKVIRSYRNAGGIFWQASRELPKRQCRRLKSGRRDCFQESKQSSEFDFRNPKPLDKSEPNDTPETAKGSMNSDCAFLETVGDVDWVRLPASPTAYDLVVKLIDSDFGVFVAPSEKTTDVSAAVFSPTDTTNPIASVTAQRGGDEAATAPIPVPAGAGYLVRFAHGSPDPESYVSYEWDFNVPGNDGTGCEV